MSVNDTTARTATTAASVSARREIIGVQFPVFTVGVDVAVGRLRQRGLNTLSRTSCAALRG